MAEPAERGPTSDPPSDAQQARTPPGPPPDDAPAKRPSVRGRKRPGPAALPKLANVVWRKGKNPRASDRNPGRPRVDDVAAKKLFFEALDKGLNVGTALRRAGCGDYVLERWRREQPGGPDALSFQEEIEIAQAKAVYPIAAVAHERATKSWRDRQFWLKHRSEEFGKRGALPPGDAARDIRALVQEARRSQVGIDDPTVIPRYDDDDDDIDTREEREAREREGNTKPVPTEKREGA